MTEELHLRYCLLYEFLLGSDVETATKNIQNALGENAIDYYRCSKWFQKFYCDNYTLSEDSGFNDEENIKVSLKVKTFSTIQKEQADALYRSRRIFARRYKDNSYCYQRRKISEYLINVYEKNKFLREVVVLDEFCVSYWTMHRMDVTEGESESTNWKLYTRLHNAKLSFWWNFRGFLHLEVIPPNTVLKHDFYSKQIDTLHAILLLKEPGPVLSRSVILQHDIDQLYAKELLDKITKLGFKVLPQPLKSPDFNCSSFRILPRLQKKFEGKMFANVESLIKNIKEFLSSQSEKFYSDPIVNLIIKWKAVLYMRQIH